MLFCLCFLHLIITLYVAVYKVRLLVLYVVFLISFTHPFSFLSSEKQLLTSFLDLASLLAIEGHFSIAYSHFFQSDSGAL